MRRGPRCCTSTLKSGIAPIRTCSVASSGERDRLPPPMIKIARTAALAASVALALTGAAPAAHAKQRSDRGRYLVGVAARSINPDPNGTFDGQPVYLGGYGVGGGSPVLAGRPATAALRDGVSVHAITTGDGKAAAAVADAELQGWFAATRDGAYGVADVRN